MNAEQNIKIRGVVTLTRRNAETMEIISEQTVTNRVTGQGIYRILRGENVSLQISTTSDELADIKSISVIDSNVLQITHQSSIIQNLNFVEGAPSYFQMISRFLQPPVSKDIKSIMLTNGSTSAAVYTRVALTPACTQLDNEILDVTYRIQIIDVNNPTVGKLYVKGMINRWLNVNNQTNGGWAFPNYMYQNWHQVPNVQYNHIRSQGANYLPITQTLATNRDVQRLRRVSFTSALLQADDVGKVFGSILFGDNANDGSNPAYIKSMTHILPAKTPEFTNAPVQPLHNHSITANAPFLDVNNLATGAGSLSMNGDSWTNPDYPKYTAIDIASDGDVGVSRYTFRQRSFTGFSGNSYYSDANAFLGFKYDRYPTEGNPTILGAHGLKTTDDLNQSVWDGRTILNSDATGITLIDIINGDYVIFDSTTVPALNVTNISQIAVDDNKTIWVADRSSGLYSISDPYGTPVITKMSSGVHGIPVGGDTNCYCVTVGSSNTIWAMFNGGLGSSTDNGTSWTIYDEVSAHPLIQAGLTDGNWGTSSKIQIDKESTNHQIGIAYTVGGNEQLIWWSLDDTVITGPLGNQAERLKCSLTGGLWVWDASNSTGENSVHTHRLTYGTTASTYFGAADYTISNLRGLPVMAYDYYDSPHYFAASNTLFNNGNATTMCTADRKFVSQMRNFGTGATNSSRQMQLNMGEGNSLGKGLYINRSNIHNSVSPSVTNICPQLNPGPYNLRHSAYSEMVWDNYKWNGVSWELNYHVDAIDTSGNSNDAVRHNFDVEDYKFTGRSIIDVTPTFSTGTFSNVGTFVFSLTPDAKLSAARTTDSAQEQHSTIFEFNDGAGNRLKLAWDNGSGNIYLYDETVSQLIVSKPADAVTYRIVVALNVIDSKVYIDGTLIAVLTLGAAIDLSNTLSNMKSYIGARTHAYAYNKKFNVGDFYRGDMTNIQLWNTEWDQTDVTNDMLDITSVIVSKPAINLISRYELTQSLVGLETKATHLTDDALLDGVTLSFTDGTSSPAFVENEYYTVGLVDGFLKDNAMSITYNGYLYLGSNVESNYSTITNGEDTNLVIGNTTVVTEAALYYGYSQDTLFTIPGEMAANSSSGSIGAKSIQSSIGDITVEFSLNHNKINNAIAGFMDPVQTQFYSNYFKHHLRFYNTGLVDVWHTTTLQSGSVTTYTLDDVFKIERVGTTVKFYKNNILFYTSGTGSTGILSVGMSAPGYSFGYNNVNITYTRAANFMIFGDAVGETGSYHPNYLGISGPTELFANGTPLDVQYSSTAYNLMSLPAPGTVYVNGYNGMILFNDAEIGTTITGTTNIITDLP